MLTWCLWVVAIGVSVCVYIGVIGVSCIGVVIDVWFVGVVIGVLVCCVSCVLILVLRLVLVLDLCVH